MSMLYKSAILIGLWLGQAQCFSQVPLFSRPRTYAIETCLSSSKLPDVEEQDWRAFRAKLVLQEQQDVEEKHGSMESDSSWAYESGSVIEQGSVILNRPPSKPYKYFGFSLGRQYLHKCVMLVLQHDPSETTGVILNRPTDLVLEDATFKAQIWYGGPVHGIHSPDPKFYCLHNLQSPAAQEVSRNVIEGIRFTTIAQARSLVESGDATPDDFWVFCGFAEMESATLTAELEESLWHSVATNAKTLRNGLRILNAGAGLDPRHAGLSTWTMLMKMIGRPPEQEEYRGEEFDDLMLREWATKYLVNFDDLMLNKVSTKNLELDEEELLKREETRYEDEDSIAIEPGTIVRGSSAPRSPFLLENQEFHKSMILIIQDDEHFSVGVLLNHPTDKHVDLQMLNAGSFFEKELTFSVPLRYGGPADIMDTEETPLFFLHNSPALRKANIGEPVGSSNTIWRCTTDDAAEAIAKRLATPQDFMVINGFCVWDKESGGVAQQVSEGNFELVPPQQSDQIWNLLLSQEHLSQETIDHNIEASKMAWSLSGMSVADHDHQPIVFKSDVKVSQLSDDAFKVWVAAFFLDDPTLRP